MSAVNRVKEHFAREQGRPPRAVGEAVVDRLPVLASRTPGSIGILGDDYPGYFQVGNTRELARSNDVREGDPQFLADLTSRCNRLAMLLDSSREQAAWVGLIDEMFPGRQDSRK